jgi:Trk K+ transport system NAD-binding subunit
VRSVRRPVVWRSLALGLTFLAAVVGLSVGVGVSERDILAAGLAERAYYALGLFVLGGLDIGTPMGGPPFGRVLLWGAYFAAPLITASALIETAIRLIGPWALRARRLEDHVVLGGAGRLTQLYVRKLRERDLRRTVVVVERDPDKPSLVALRDVYRAVIMHGDITKDEVLERARVDRARQVLFLTNDDFANLDAASKVLKTAPGLEGRIVVHVSDLGFMRETASSSVAEACEFFNGHEFAAVNLVQEQLVDRFNSTPQIDLVVLAGFGRFGQTVLHQLQQHAAGSFSHVIIIDERASRQVRAFEAQPGTSGDYVFSVIDGDILDPDAWRRVGEVVEAHGHDPVVILGCGSDGTNLHAALLARRQHPSAYVIVRSFRASPFTAEIAEESGVHAFNLAGLIEQGMPEAWF